MIECHEQYTSPSTTGRGGDRFNRCATSSRSSKQNCHDRRDFWARWSFTTITQQARLKCAIDCIRQGFGCDCSSEKNNRSTFLDHSQQLCTDESVRRARIDRWNFVRPWNQFTASGRSTSWIFISTGWSTRYANEYRSGNHSSRVVRAGAAGGNH